MQQILMQQIRLAPTLLLLALVPQALAAPQSAPRVAIAAAAASSLTDCRFTDLQSKLQLTGRFAAVDIVDVVSATPTVAELLNYDSIITWADVQYYDSAGFGDVLAAYVDVGGGVVVTGYANMTQSQGVFLRGRWLTGAYEVIRHTAGLQGGAASLGAVLDPSHPVARNVNVLSGNTVARPFLQANFALNQGRVLIEWNDGRMLAAVSNVHPKRVDLGLVPISSDCIGGYLEASSDLTTLVANALEFAATGGTIGVNYCVAAPNSAGHEASVLLNGSSRAADNDLELLAVGLPLNSNGFFLCSRMQGFVATPGGSQGNLCLGGGVGMFGQQVRNSGNIGSIAIQADLLNLPTSSGSVAAHAGETWCFQAWYRDANPMPTSNFSRGTTLTFE
jgi:hypothetical protein